MDPQTTAILQQVFPGVDPDSVHMLLEMGRRAEYEAGAVLCRQGAVEDMFYIILDGAVDVSQQIESGRERHLATLATGGYFGEMGLLDNRPRLAMVTTRAPTTVLEINGVALQRVIEASPQIGSELTRRILAILRANDENFWKTVLEKEAAQKELEIGRRIQQSFLPPEMPTLSGWEIISFLQPAGVVSGDFYDAMVFDDNRVLLVLGDVCDKGVGAALYMALFRSLVRAFAEHHYHGHRPEREMGQSADEAIAATMRDTLQKTILFTNSYLTRHHARTNMFATLFFAVLEPDSGYVAYVNGGHEPPIVTGPQGIRCRLGSTGPLVGIIPGVSYDVGEVWLGPGETLLAFTDGVTEATDSDKQIFGRDQVLALLQEPGESATALVERISAAISAHVTGAPQSDDITMLAVRRVDRSEP